MYALSGPNDATASYAFTPGRAKICENEYNNM